MLSQQISQSVVIDGEGFTVDETGTPFPTAPLIDIELAPAKTGTLTARADANTGSLTLEASHGVVDADLIDVYWDGGSRRQMVVGTVAGQVVPVDGGAGDDLPAISTELTAMVPTEWDDISFDDGDVVALGMKIIGTEKMCQISLGENTTAYAEAGAIILNGSTWGPVLGWSDDKFGTNPINGFGTINKLFISHGDAANTATFRAKMGIT